MGHAALLISSRRAQKGGGPVGLQDLAERVTIICGARVK